MAAYKALIYSRKEKKKMKKEYETPKVERMDFDYTETVVASGSGRTDQSTTEWYTCDWRYVDVQSIDGTVCGAV